MYHLATSKVCLVDTYIIPVSILKHKKDLKIIQLCHGIGNIKKFGYQTAKNKNGKNNKLSKLLNMHYNYDYLISTSKETSNYYSEAFNMPLYKILEILKIFTFLYFFIKKNNNFIHIILKLKYHSSFFLSELISLTDHLTLFPSFHKPFFQIFSFGLYISPSPCCSPFFQ